jgi:rRNA maturation RNase YbeY
MIRVYLNKQSNYPISSPKLKKRLKDFLREQGIVSDSDVNVSLVGKKKMIGLGKKYLNEKDNLHNVLSFTEEEVRGDFVYPPGDKIHLGEIIVCYPKAFDEAKNEGKLIEEKVWELIEHGAYHLLGKHH